MIKVRVYNSLWFLNWRLPKQDPMESDISFSSQYAGLAGAGRARGHFSHKTLIGGGSRVAKKRKMKKKKKEERKKDLINLMRRGWVTLRSRASELSRPRPVAPRCERFCNPNPIQNPSLITHAPDAPHRDGAAAEPACDFLLTGWLLLLLQRRQPTADAADEPRGHRNGTRCRPRQTFGPSSMPVRHFFRHRVASLKFACRTTGCQTFRSPWPPFLSRRHAVFSQWCAW